MAFCEDTPADVIEGMEKVMNKITTAVNLFISLPPHFIFGLSHGLLDLYMTYRTTTPPSPPFGFDLYIPYPPMVCQGGTKTSSSNVAISTT
jgi:hypothetical protein